MMKPECQCFEEGRGDGMVLVTASETVRTCGDMINATGLCRASFEYTMLMTIVLLMRSFAAQEVGELDNERERAGFRAMLPDLVGKLVECEAALDKEAMVAIAEQERASAGGLQ